MPGVPPPPRSDLPPTPTPTPLLRTWRGEGEKGPSKCPGRARGTPAAGRPYLGSKACPRRARRREAPAGAARPRRARGRPCRRLPSRTARAAPGPADLPPFAAPVGKARRPQTRLQGWALGQARSGGVRGSPGSADCRRLGLPRSLPQLPAGTGRAGQGSIFSESCSPSWTDRTS